MDNPAAHVPIRRVLEKVAVLPGVEPLRVFPLLLPMWTVGIKSVVRETQPYEIFDRFLSLAIGRAGVRDVAGLAGFFAVEPALVERTLRFLDAIGHLHRDGEILSLTAIGMSSINDDQRYVIKEDRQVLYFDGFTSAPLPKNHYEGAVWLDEPHLRLSGGTRFQAVADAGMFRPEALKELERRADREEYNLPAGLASVEPTAIGRSWLPTYVIECVSELLFYVKAIEGPDSYLSALATPYLNDALRAEKPVDDIQVWRDWLAGRGFRDVEPRRLPNRVLRAALPAAAFGKSLEWWRLGSFETQKHSFLQLWCDDDQTRLWAVLVRVGMQVSRRGLRDVDSVERRLSDLSAQLEVSTLEVKDLQAYARAESDDALSAALEGLIVGGFS